MIAAEIANRGDAVGDQQRRRRSARLRDMVCMSIRPGIRKRPLPSTMCAPGARGRAAVGPTNPIRSPRTRTEPRRGASSSIDRIVAFRIRSAGDAGDSCVELVSDASTMDAMAHARSQPRIGIPSVYTTGLPSTPQLSTMLEAGADRPGAGTNCSAHSRSVTGPHRTSWRVEAVPRSAFQIAATDVPRAVPTLTQDHRRAARRAGVHAASTPTATSTAAAPANVSGSRASRWNIIV